MTKITLEKLAQMIQLGFTSMGNTQEEMNHRLNNLETGQITTNRRLRNLEVIQGETNKRLDSLEAGQKSIFLKLDTFAYKSDINNLKQRVETLEQKAPNNNI